MRVRRKICVGQSVGLSTGRGTELVQIPLSNYLFLGSLRNEDSKIPFSRRISSPTVLPFSKPVVPRVAGRAAALAAQRDCARSAGDAVSCCSRIAVSYRQQ